MEVETSKASSPFSAYDILGVAPTATQDDIRVAYRIAARRYHPDTNSNPDAKDLFISATEAYELLSDVTKRKKYDAVRKILQQEKQKEAEINNKYTGNQGFTSGSVLMGNVGIFNSGSNINIRPQYTGIFGGSANIHMP